MPKAKTEYAYYLFERIEEDRARGAEYSHPIVRIGEVWHDGVHGDYFTQEAEVAYQVSLRPDTYSTDGHLTNDGLPYGGHLAIDNPWVAERYGHLVVAALERGRKLLPTSNNSVDILITGLRAGRVRRAILDKNNFRDIVGLD